MAALPPLRIENRCDPFDWCVCAHADFLGETITFDLRFGSNESEWRPDPPRPQGPDDPEWREAYEAWEAVIEDTLRAQTLWDSHRSLVERARERAAEPITLYFFN